MDILHPDIESYLAKQIQSPHPVFMDMEKRAERLRFPIIGPVVGNLLRQYAALLNARHIFEMGSGYGYSALWFALGLPENGRIICTDASADNIQLMKAFFTSAGQQTKLDARQGDAIEILLNETGPFDIILMDIDKRDYVRGFDAAWPRLRPGGLFIADNVLWKGQVTDPEPDERTRAILEFTQRVLQEQQALTSIIPIRDGVLVALKKE